MGPSDIGFLSFRIIFHFHDYGRKGSIIPNTHKILVRYIYLLINYRKNQPFM